MQKHINMAQMTNILIFILFECEPKQRFFCLFGCYSVAKFGKIHAI
jgi:hypothetical protein